MKKIEFKLLGNSNLKDDQKAEGIKDLYDENIFPSSFFMVLIGKPGSGKSTIIEEMLLNTQLLNNKFDHILVHSPYPLKNIECIEGENYFNKLDFEFLFNTFNELNNRKEIDKYVNMLLIFDDMVATIKENKQNQLFLQLFYNRRHLIKNGCISVMLTTQKFLVIPSAIRPCINIIVLFQINASELTALKQDIVSWIDFKKISQKITNSFDFLYINLVNGFIYYNLQEKI